MEIYGYNLRKVYTDISLDEARLIKYKRKYVWEYVDSEDFDNETELFQALTSKNGFIIPSNTEGYFPFRKTHLNLRASEVTISKLKRLIERAVS